MTDRFDPRKVPVRFSNLKLLSKSPAHYLHAIRLCRVDKAVFRAGRLIHKLVFGFDDFVIYDGTRRGKAWDAFQSANDGTEIFSQSEYDKAEPVAESILSHPMAKELIRGDLEKTLHWQIGGRECHGTPDIASADHLVDLKTTIDAQPDRFTRQGIRYGYHAQLAWYTDAREFCGYQRPRDIYVWSVEKEAPYVSTVHRLTERALDQGRRQCRLWWEQLQICEQSGHWPGYAQTVVDFDVPDDDFSGSIDFESEELVA